MHNTERDLLSRLCRFLWQLRERLHFEGIIRFREIPGDWDEAAWRHWWLPEWNEDRTKMLAPARMSPKEKERYTVHEARNILTTNGRTQILTYIGASTGYAVPFAQYFAVGTFPLNTVSPGDASVSSEIFRAVPSTAIITGTQLDLSTLIGSSQAVGTLTNAGIYGGGTATSSSGTGVLYTHALLNNFVKANGASYSADYLINLT